MKYLLSFAFKNMFRKKERTLLTMLPMLFGTMVLIFAVSILDGIALDSEKNLRDYEVGDVRITRSDFSSDGRSNPKEFLFPLNNELKVFLSSSSSAEAYTPMIIFQANLSDGFSKLPVLCAGIDAKSYGSVFRTFAAGGSRAPLSGESVAGLDLLKFFDIDEDSVLIVEARTSHDTYDALDVRLEGSVNTGNPNIDRNFIFIPYEDASNFLDAENMASALFVKMKNRSNESSFSEDFNRMSSENGWGLKAEDFRQTAMDVIAVTAAKNQTSAILIIVILLIGGVGIANTILLSVYERTKEIGTLRAMGASGGVIMKLFLFEGTFIGLFGAAAGFIAGTLMMAYLSVKGIDLSPVIGNIDIGYPVKSIFRADFNVFTSLKSAAFAAVIAFFCSVYPAYRATRENIVRILK